MSIVDAFANFKVTEILGGTSGGWVDFEQQVMLLLTIIGK